MKDLSKKGRKEPRPRRQGVKTDLRARNKKRIADYESVLMQTFDRISARMKPKRNETVSFVLVNPEAF